MNRVKYYNSKGELTVIYVSQTTANYSLNISNSNRVMTPREAEFYASKAGLTRKKPKLIDSSK